VEKDSNLIVITSYPEQGLVHGIITVGVASYAKNTLLSLSEAAGGNLNIVVLAEKLSGQKSKYQEKNITVIRCWQRNSWFVYFSLIKNIAKQKAESVLIEFEMAMFGNPAINIPFPAFLLLLRLLRKKTTVVLHQVVLNFDEMSGQIGEKQSGLKTKILSILAKYFYKSILKTASQVIVFEEFLKQRLLGLANLGNIFVVPHGVEIKTILPDQKKSKNKLRLGENDFVIIMFGYLAWYKGTDWLVSTISHYLDHSADKNIDTHGQARGTLVDPAEGGEKTDQFIHGLNRGILDPVLKLIVAGGPNPNHLDKAYYQKYLRSLDLLAKRHPNNIKITGYVNEKDINSYYQAADLVVFPYRASMSSSGPLAFAYTNRIPFLVSEKLAELFDTKDAYQNLKSLKIKKEQLSFRLDENDFWQKVDCLRNDINLQNKLGDLCKKITISRSWKKIGEQYLKIL